MNSSSAFHTGYLNAIRETLDAIDATAVARIVSELAAALRARRTVFVAGNGGSASLASHFACDLGKSLLGAKPLQSAHTFRVISLADNMATLTAWANDEGFEHVFREPLRALASPGDVFVAITASGNSPNIVEALRWARGNEVRTLGLLGKSGGKSLELCDACAVVPSNDYGHIEGIHAVLTHEITSWLMAELGVDARVVG